MGGRRARLGDDCIDGWCAFNRTKEPEVGKGCFGGTVEELVRKRSLKLIKRRNCFLLVKHHFYIVQCGLHPYSTVLGLFPFLNSKTLILIG